jgi:putative transposase
MVFRQLLKAYESVPRVLITDTLGRPVAAQRKVLRSVEHRQHRGLHHRAENAPRPPRGRERARPRFQSPGQAQRFLAAVEPISGPCRRRRHRLPATVHRRERQVRRQAWDEVAEVRAVA